MRQRLLPVQEHPTGKECVDIKMVGGDEGPLGERIHLHVPLRALADGIQHQACAGVGGLQSRRVAIAYEMLTQ